ncbi:DUF6176 family protein [Arthrobacter sp. S41]|uniref:DUF6176 family protein n=1 Tax=Arthrobacter sp. S41 TaxID=2509721 RepID=UPI00103573F8|nr:DUF6176 family protein [Arthrobacter sp. S41]TAP25978.1 hypothetical protein EYR88_13620 [Arthrobacter sp. S41]
MNIELTRFRVLPGKSAAVDEWMDLLNDNLPAVLKTLDDEKMYVETIFSETLDGIDYLYWYSIQGEGGTEVQDSNHEIDKAHLKFWKECIDPDFPPQDLQTRVSMIPDRIRSSMK